MSYLSLQHQSILRSFQISKGETKRRVRKCGALIDQAIATYPSRPGIADQVAQFTQHCDEEGYLLAKRYLAAQQQVLIESCHSAYVNLQSLPSDPPESLVLTLLVVIAESPGISPSEVRSRCMQLGVPCSRNQLYPRLKNLRERGLLEVASARRRIFCRLTNQGKQLLASDRLGDLV